jgi:hypothetical protein
LYREAHEASKNESIESFMRASLHRLHPLPPTNSWRRGASGCVVWIGSHYGRTVWIGDLAWAPGFSEEIKVLADAGYTAVTAIDALEALRIGGRGAVGGVCLPAVISNSVDAESHSAHNAEKHISSSLATERK